MKTHTTTITTTPTPGPAQARTSLPCPRILAAFIPIVLHGLALAGLTLSAHAQAASGTTVWGQAGGGAPSGAEWHAAGNWSTAVPDAITAALIQNMDATGSPFTTMPVITGELAISHDILVGGTDGSPAGTSGALVIRDSGTLDSQAGYIGNAANTTGIVIVGTDSVWNTNNNDINIGYLGSGTLEIGNGGKVSGGAIIIASDAAATGALVLTGGVLETTGIEKGAASAGTAAALFLNGGTIRATADNADFFKDLGTLTLTGSSGKTSALTLDVVTDATVTATNVISGSVSNGYALVKGGGGTLILSASHSYSGTTRVAAGTLTIARTGVINGPVNNASVLTNAGVIRGAVTNSGSFVNTGSVGGATTISGGFVTNSGTLNAVTVNGGTLVSTGGRVAGTTTIGPAGTVVYYGGSLTGLVVNGRLEFANSTNNTHGTAFSGTGHFVKSGTGNLTLSAVNTFTGSATIERGRLIANTNNVLAQSWMLTINAGATFDLNSRAQTLRNVQANGGTILYSTSAMAQSGTFVTLTVNGNFTGSSAHYMNVNVGRKRTDQLTVLDTASGEFRLVLTNSGSAASDPNNTYALQVFKFGLGNPTIITDGVDDGMRHYNLIRGDRGSLMPDVNTYYLAATDSLSRAGDAILKTAGVAGTEWHYGLDNVSKRMGDIRSTVARDTGSVWARGYGYGLNASSSMNTSSFDQSVYGLDVGIDKARALGGSIISGGAFIGMSTANRHFDNRGGTGESTGVGFGLYALWMHDAGWYASSVLKFDRHSNKLDPVGLDNHRTHAKYNSQTQGISLELGRRMTNKAGYWFEPSAQAAVAWINGVDYTATHDSSGTMRVSIADAQAWQYNVQLRAGMSCGQWQPYIKTGATKSNTNGGEVRVNGLEYCPWFDGWRFEVGFGAAYLINERNQVYLDYEYSRADKYERPVAINIGYRRIW